MSRRVALEGGLVAATILAAILTLRGPAQSQGFTIDESRWIATSRYFWVTLIDHEFFGPDWQPNYVILTHPPVARYIIGFGLWLQGWTPAQLNGRYDSFESRAYNLRAGNIPSPDLLAAARRITFLFAVSAVALIYTVGRMLGGPVAGVGAAGFTLMNPLLTTLWTRALAESILATFTLLTLALALWVLARLATRRVIPWVPLLAGGTLALAAATKLSGGIDAIGLATYASLQQGTALLTSRRTIGLRSWLDVALVATVLFVAVNPLLWQRPVERAVMLVQHRQREMQFQQATFTDQAVPADPIARVGTMARRVFVSFATPRGPLPVSMDVLLVPLGLLVLARRVMTEQRARVPERATLVLCWIAASYAIVTTNLGFDSSHYYASLIALNVLLMGLATEAAVRLLRARLGDGWRLLPWGVGQKTQEPARYSGSLTTQTIASAPMATHGNGVPTTRSSTHEPDDSCP